MSHGSIMKIARDVVTLMIFLLWVSSYVVGQSLDSKLSQPVEAFDSESSTIEGQLLDFARHFKIPIGLELLVANEEPTTPIHIKGGTIANVLRMIIAKKPEYDFDIGDGVINLYSTRFVGDARNFLNLRLPKFQIKNQNLIGARYYLKLSIQQTLHPNVNYGGGYGGVQLNNNLHVANLTYSANNLSVREILNALILLHGQAGWVVRLNASERMQNEHFYAQALSPITADVAPGFYWEFVALQ